MVGAILTQNTAWANVERAIARLKAADVLSPAALRRLPLENVASLIRPAGTFQAKARKLKALGELLGRYGDDLARLFNERPLSDIRRELLAVHGIGPETADAILLYAAGNPSFVVDAFTQRVLGRLGLIKEKARYEEVKTLFEARLPPDPALFNEYHALLVEHGKRTCRKREPRCRSCPLLDLCPTGQAALG
ncbi:MAG: hypothetical protein HY685_04140 [Chloroflexi bacterium]|nr:hypothetical protein [Chloroflexota bacterium]